MNFLMDFINEVAGYTEKHYDEMEERVDTESLIKKYREEFRRLGEQQEQLAEGSVQSED